MNTDSLINFREQLHNRIESRADSTMDLIDALSGNTSAQSVPELSLIPSYHRGHSSLYKSIAELEIKAKATPSDPSKAQQQPSQTSAIPEANKSEQASSSSPCLDLIADLVPTPSEYPFLVFVLDVTPCPRSTARTLKDRSFVHSPNPISTNKPVTIGHEYSIVSALPEDNQTQGVPWTIPLMGQRVDTQSSATTVANQQVSQLFSPGLPWQDQWVVMVCDSYYSNPNFLYPQAERDHCVVITRARSNRVFYHQPEPSEEPHSGHPSWYGERFALEDPSTWHSPDEVIETHFLSSRGQDYPVNLQAWHNLLMRGTQEAPMHQHPFTLIRIEINHPLTGIRLKPMWLIMVGQRRGEITALTAWQVYRKRFNQEHCFRFLKQRLLMSDFQTPEVEHEQNWIQLTLLAYVQLWAARGLANCLPRPWEPKQAPAFAAKPTKVTPSMVQRDFARIIAQIGTPAEPPKLRGYSSGRTEGNKQTPRPRYPVVRKVKKGTKDKQKAA